MKSNKSIICFVIIICFSINGLFSESTKNLNLKEVEKIKQHAQIKERAKQTKEFKKRIDRQKKLGFAKKRDINKMLQVGSYDITPNWDRLSRSSTNADSIYILINGSDSIVTVTQFDSLTVSVTFSNGQNIATWKYGLDMNNNGIWEEALDHKLFSSSIITDNNYEDKNSADGIWEMTWDQPQNIAGLSLFILVEDGGGSDVINLVIEPKKTDYSISGNLVDESDVAIGTAHLFVQAFSMDDASYDYYYEDFSVGVTDSDGSYQLYLHDAGTYDLEMYDEWSVGNLLLDDPYYEEILVDGHETGYDFTVLAANAWIDGYVKDDDGNPVSDAQVNSWSYAEYYDDYGVDNDILGTTDAEGYFLLPVLYGGWQVNTYNYDLIPEYMDTPNADNMVTAIEDDTIAVGSDFMIYKTDAIISGNIYLDDAPYTGHAIISGYNGNWVWDYNTYESSYNGTGYTYTETADGSYNLHVASEGDDLGYWEYHWGEYGYYDSSFVAGYDVNMDFWELPENVIPSFDSLHFHSGIQSGSTDINFYLTTVSGGFEGVVTDDLDQALEGAWIYASGFIEGNAGESLWYWNQSSTDEMGNYTLYLPAGDYEVLVEYWDYDNYEEIYCSANFDASVGTSFIEKDIEMTQVAIDGSVSGQITDKEGYAIYGHYVYVQGDGGCEGAYGWSDYDYTDEYGNYHMDLPSGNYTIGTSDYCSDYDNVSEDFVINATDEKIDFAVCEYYDYDDVCGCWYENEIDDCGNTQECWDDGEVLCEGSGYDDEYSCENAGPCMWEGDCDGPDNSPLECIQDCPGIENLGPYSDPIESCSIITAISDDSCTDDCGWEESMMIGMMELICDMYDECIDEGYSEIVCEEFFEGNDGYGDEEEGGSPECMQDCPGVDDVGPDADPAEYCTFVTSISDDTCADDCGMEESMMIGMMELMCDMYDECIDEGYSESVCEEFFDMDDGPGDEEEDGPPECVMDCEGVYSVDPQGDTEQFCEWIIPTLGDTDCAEDCDAEVTTELTEMFDICTDCISEGNCAEADLSADEKNLLLPKEFALHLVYPNPFNPTTDIGFSLELAGPVSISVYDVTGRQIATILQNDFRNAGSHIISWNGSHYPSGIYFIHMQAGRQVDIQKVTLLK